MRALLVLLINSFGPGLAVQSNDGTDLPPVVDFYLHSSCRLALDEMT